VQNIQKQRCITEKYKVKTRITEKITPDKNQIKTNW